MPGEGSDPIERVAAQVRAQIHLDARHAASCTELISALRELDRPFDRAADRRHITASALVVGQRGVLFHLHRRAHRWMQPGGHVDPGECPEGAVAREVLEETGLVASHLSTGARLAHVDAHEASDGRHLDLRYLMLGPDRPPDPPPGESPEVAWLRVDEALERCERDPAISSLLEALAEGRDGSGSLPSEVTALLCRPS